MAATFNSLRFYTQSTGYRDKATARDLEDSQQQNLKLDILYGVSCHLRFTGWCTVNSHLRTVQVS